MARFTLGFILLAAALGYAIQPAATLNKSIPPSNLAAFSTPPGEQLPSVTTDSRNDVAFGTDNDGICYKIRAYIFKRDDDHAPQYVRSTTCGPRQPRAKNATWPKARLVPAD